MEKLIQFTSSDLAKITNHRSGEIKFGEKMITIPKDTDLVSFIKSTEAKYVLLGMPEDIGIRSDRVRRHGASAGEAAIESIANIQHNRFCKGSQTLALGQIDVKEVINELTSLDFIDVDDRSKLSQLVKRIDKEVSHIICTIIQAG